MSENRLLQGIEGVIGETATVYLEASPELQAAHEKGVCLGGMVDVEGAELLPDAIYRNSIE